MSNSFNEELLAERERVRAELEEALRQPYETLVDMYVDATENGDAPRQYVSFATLVLWCKLDAIDDLLREMRR